MSIRCRACGAAVSRTFVDLGLSPLSNSYVAAEDLHKGERFYPLHALVCENCFLVQLAEFEPPENIFSANYAYLSSFSSSWLEHARRYADMMIVRLGLKPDAHVAEVASNDGYLLKWFVERGYTVTGIEPAANCAEIARTHGIHTECRFFGKQAGAELAASRGRADIIAANNVLAHVPDILDFVAGFREFLKPNGVATFEFPHLLNLIELNQFDTIYHEHFSYLSLGVVRRVLQSASLRVFNVEQIPTHGGSLRVFACHNDALHKPEDSVESLLSLESAKGLTNIDFLSSYGDRVVDTKNDLLELLVRLRRDGKLVAGYGAPAKGNTLLNYCGIGPEYIRFTVDRNPLKQNTCLPGSRIPVHAPDAIGRNRPDYVVILPWNIRDEIVDELKHAREWGCKFITAVPSVKVF